MVSWLDTYRPQWR